MWNCPTRNGNPWTSGGTFWWTAPAPKSAVVCPRAGAHFYVAAAGNPPQKRYRRCSHLAAAGGLYGGHGNDSPRPPGDKAPGFSDAQGGPGAEGPGCAGRRQPPIFSQTYRYSGLLSGKSRKAVQWGCAFSTSLSTFRGQPSPWGALLTQLCEISPIISWDKLTPLPFWDAGFRMGANRCEGVCADENLNDINTLRGRVP